MPALLNVANILSNKMANRRCIDMAYQVRSKYKAPIQRNHYIQPLSTRRFRNLPS
jgi:hypothetical protein